MTNPVSQTQQMITTNAPAISVEGVFHRYGQHEALRGIDLQIPTGQIFALLGPNGSGKTTLFRLICTLMPLQCGSIRVAGASVAQRLAVRQRIGIVFQAPSLDKKLTVDENIACQAALYGLSGAELRSRRDEVLGMLNLIDRRHELCERLSGGLKRRVELAKGLLHRPQVLLLDEPSTGLDPTARLDLWVALRQMVADGITVVLTTHLFEEADKADTLAIMDCGQVVSVGTPASLRLELGEGLIMLQTEQPEEAALSLQSHFDLQVQQVGQQLRIQTPQPVQWVSRIADHLGDSLHSITVGRPGLEDVFVAKTGNPFCN